MILSRSGSHSREVPSAVLLHRRSRISGAQASRCTACPPRALLVTRGPYSRRRSPRLTTRRVALVGPGTHRQMTATSVVNKGVETSGTTAAPSTAPNRAEPTRASGERRGPNRATACSLMPRSGRGIKSSPRGVKWVFRASRSKRLGGECLAAAWRLPYEGQGYTLRISDPARDARRGGLIPRARALLASPRLTPATGERTRASAIRGTDAYVRPFPRMGRPAACCVRVRGVPGAGGSADNGRAGPRRSPGGRGRRH